MDDYVTTILTDMPTSIKGLCTFGSDGMPLIIINSKMSVEQQRKTYRHEMEHIRCGHLWDPEYDDSVEYGGAS